MKNHKSHALWSETMKRDIHKLCPTLNQFKHNWENGRILRFFLVSCIYCQCFPFESFSLKNKQAWGFLEKKAGLNCHLLSFTISFCFPIQFIPLIYSKKKYYTIDFIFILNISGLRIIQTLKYLSLIPKSIL